MENIKHSMQDIDDVMERTNLLNSRIQEGENRKETIAEKIIAEKFPILIKRLPIKDMGSFIGCKRNQVYYSKAVFDSELP